MTYNTGNPIGSTDARDRSDNSENLDLAVNSLSQTFVDRLGVTRDTFEGIYQKSAYYRAGTFDAGYTLTNNRQTLAYGNVEYSWSGEFPKAVPAGAAPVTSGGIGVGAWVDRTQETIRSELISGDHPELLPYESRTVSERLSESIYVEDYRQIGMSDTSAFAAAISALPASGGVIKISNGRTYEVTGITNTKPYLKITGHGTIKAAASSSDTPAFYSDIAGAIIELDSIMFDGNKLNQTGSNKHTVHIKYASKVTLDKCVSMRAQRQHFFLEECDEVLSLHTTAKSGGKAISAGDTTDIRSTGLSTLRCNNVMIIGGDYSENSYLGTRVSGYESVFSQPEWTASEAVTVGAIRLPTTRTKMYAECTTAGTTGSTEPTWAVPSVAGSTYSDGTAVWTMRDPLCENITIIGAKTDDNYGDFGSYEWAIGCTIACAKNVKLSLVKSRNNAGNNFDLNRCWNTEVLNCDGIGSLNSQGINPDYTSDILGLGGGDIKIIGGEYTDNEMQGVLVQQAYQGTGTEDYSGVIIQSVKAARNGSAGIAGQTCGSLVIDSCELEDNGVTSQIGVLPSSLAEETPTFINGKVTIARNKFRDKRTTKAPYNLYFGVHSDALNPEYNKMCANEPVIMDNEFGDYTTKAIYSAGPTRGGQPWFRNALIRNNTGLEGYTNVNPVFDVAAFGSDKFIQVKNLDSFIINTATAQQLLGMYGFSIGKKVTIFFETANTTIYDKDTGTGSAGNGNIQLLSGSTLVPAAGTVYEFIYLNGAWYQL